VVEHEERVEPEQQRHEPQEKSEVVAKVHQVMKQLEQEERVEPEQRRHEPQERSGLVAKKQ
jgi:hypothetical protein